MTDKSFVACLEPPPPAWEKGNFQPCCREKGHPEGEHAWWVYTGGTENVSTGMPGRGAALWYYGPNGRAIAHADLEDDGTPLDPLEAAALMWLLDRRNRP